MGWCSVVHPYTEQLVRVSISTLDSSYEIIFHDVTHSVYRRLAVLWRQKYMSGGDANIIRV